MIEKLIKTSPLKRTTTISRNQNSYARSTSNVFRYRSILSSTREILFIPASRPKSKRAGNDWASIVKYLICHGVFGHLSATGQRCGSHTYTHTSVESLPRIELTKWSMGRTTFLRD